MSTAGLVALSERWPNGNVRYAFDIHINPALLPLVAEAMASWSSKTCITFTEWDGVGEDFIAITSMEDLGCLSDYIGYSGASQVLNLEVPGCDYVGIVAHELGHHIGLWHEQSRPDRDSFVRINFENIEEDMRSNFMKRTTEDINTEGLPYDYDSIMHYSQKAFSRNGEDTISVINEEAYRSQGYPMLGQRDHLSSEDVAIVNLLYGCPQK